MKMMMTILRTFRCAVRRWLLYCVEDDITVFAAQASFFILISAIPMVMLVVPLLQYLIPEKSTIITEIFSTIVPEASGLRSFVLEILDDIYTTSAGAIVSVSAIAAIWAASKGIFALQEGLNKVGKYEVKANYIQRRAKAVGFTLAFIPIILFAVVFLMFGDTLESLLLSLLPGIPYLSLAFTLLRSIIAFELFLHFFIVVYAVFPSGRTYFSDNIPSAVFSTVGWMIFSYIYAFYINNIAGNSYIYGSLTALVLLMLWLYFCLIIFFAGAELNKIILTRSRNFKFTARIAEDVMEEVRGENLGGEN